MCNSLPELQNRCYSKYVVSLNADLASKTDLDQSRADMIVDCLEDLRKSILIAFKEQDQTKKVVS